MASYLNEFIETIQGVPDEVQRNFCLLRDLDSAYTAHNADLLSLHDKYIKELHRQTSDTISTPSAQYLLGQEKELKKIRLLYETTLQCADEKISIASQSYDLVDEHIKRLDAKLLQFEAELIKSGHFNRAYAAGGTTGDLLQLKGSYDGTEKRSHRKQDRSRGSQDKSRARKRKASQQSNIHAVNVNKLNKRAGIAAAVVYSEPVYCTCKRPSFGKMVGCENEDCEISWYHIECVGLKDLPRSYCEDEKWYCATCIAAGYGKT